jgi:hypothetical protein
LGLLLGGLGEARAGVIQINSQAALSASGTIVQNTNWDAYGPGFFFPPSPFTVGDLTFIAGGQNLIGGTGTGYNLARNLFTDNFVRGTTIQTAGAFDLFGLNAGNFFSAGNTTFTVVTNLSTYTFNESLNSAVNQAPLTFVGFEATGGEFFTSVAWSSNNATGVTDVQLGTAVAAIPEPSSLILLGTATAGLAGCVGWRRRKRSQAA